MDKKGILNKIKELFSTEKFEQDYKTQDGRIIRCYGGLDVGTAVKEITEDGEMDVEDGNYVLEDGMVLIVKGGMIENVEETTGEEMGDMDIENDDVMMEGEYKNEINTKLMDGTEVRILSKGDALSVGDAVEVKDAEGNFVKAPEGRHELEGGLVVYVDAEGYINEMETAQTDKTTEKEEGMAEMAEVFSALSSLVDEVKKLRDEVKSVKKENTELKNNFNQFSKSPSAEPTKHEVKFSKQDKDAKLKFFAR